MVDGDGLFCSQKTFEVINECVEPSVAIPPVFPIMILVHLAALGRPVVGSKIPISANGISIGNVADSDISKINNIYLGLKPDLGKRNQP